MTTILSTIQKISSVSENYDETSSWNDTNSTPNLTKLHTQDDSLRLQIYKTLVICHISKKKI